MKIKESKWYTTCLTVVSILILTLIAVLTVKGLNKVEGIPWGSDTYGHLYKANILYDALKEGQLFLNYDWNWYNGVEPFRYWAPMPYYILASLNFLVKDIEKAYDLFLIVVFVVGGTGFVTWGKYLKRPMLGLTLGVLWFFIPNNIRVLFGEGNLPAVLVTTFLPYIFLYYYKSIQEEKKRDLILLAIFMAIITLNHAMLTAMTGITLFIYGMIYGVCNKKYKQVIRPLVYAVLGIFTMGFWLIPALKGGIMSLNSNAAGELMKQLSFPLKQSLNPFIRVTQADFYYFGLSFALIILFGVLFTYKKEKSAYITAAIILMGTTTMALPILSHLPFGQLLWMKRFTSLAMCLICIGLMTWKSLRKFLLIGIIGLMSIDGGTTYALLGFKIPVEPALLETMDTAIEVAEQRIALLDVSQSDSYPSYYFTYNKKDKKVGQVFGWAWQGAGTAQNIVGLNTALEEGYYGVMLDRALELGADTLIIPEKLIKEPELLQKWADKVGYKLISDFKTYRIYKYPVTGEFATKVHYKGLLIGDKAPNLEYIFPTFTRGESFYIDDYAVKELAQYDTLFLSGFYYHNKETAQKVLKEVAQKGTHVVMDTVGQTETLFNLRLQPVQIKEAFETIYHKGKPLATKPFPRGFEDFRTNFIAQEVTEEDENYAVLGYQKLNYMYKHQPNLYTIALNLPYYAYITKDTEVIHILEELLGLKAYELPDRKVVPLKVDKISSTEFILHAEEEDVIVPIAYLDTLKALQGDFSAQNHLLKVAQAETHLVILPAYSTLGWIVSAISSISLVVLGVIGNKGIKKKISHNREETKEIEFG